MDQLISKLETIPLSLFAVRKAAPPSCKVLLYDAIRATTRQGFFGNKKPAIVLYQLHKKSGMATDQVGHFVALINRKNKPVLYHSSYGLAPEAEIAATHSGGKIIKILGKDFEYNRTALQKMRKAVTCGLHALMRVHLWNMQQPKYLQLVTSRFHPQNPDDLVSACMLLTVKNLLY